MISERAKLIAASLLAGAATVFLFDYFTEKLGGDVIAVSGGAAEGTSGAIVTELRAIRRLLENQPRGRSSTASRRAPAPAVLKVSVAGSPSLGNPKAPLTLVEFTDYQCPFCNRFHQQTFPQLKKNYIDKGKLRYVVRDLPLRFHPNALKAAQAAHCAGEQGKFWAMQDVLFKNAKNLAAAQLPGYAAAVGLDRAKFGKCLAGPRYLKEIRASAADANRLGITGTPSFVIGRNIGNDTVQGRKLVGAQPYAAFELSIKQAQAAVN